MSKRKIEVEISADDKKLKGGIDSSKKQLGGFQDAVKKVGGALVAAFAAKKVLTGLKNLTVGLANTADRLLDLSDITGMSTDVLQEYEYVARIAGVNTEALANASMGLTQRMARATSEASPLNVAMRQLGVNLREVNGDLRAGDKVMEDVIRQLAEMDNVTERNVLGSQIFSGAWKDMAPILAMGADGIERVKQEARDMGLVMDRQTLVKANEMRQSMERLGAVSTMLGNEFTMMLVPAITSVAEALAKGVGELNNMIRGMRAVNSNENLTFWQKLGTHARMALGMMNKDMGMVADAMTVVIDSVELYNQKIEDAAESQASASAGHIAKLGDIQRIEDEIAEAKKEYISATSDMERVAAIRRIETLEAEKKLLEDIAHRKLLIARINEGAPQQMSAIGIEPLQMDHAIEQLEEVEHKVRDVRDAIIDWQEIASGAAASIGMSFMQMAQDSSRSVSDVIKQLLAQVTAQLIAQFTATLPPPLSLIAAGGAGAIAGGLFNQIPAFAGGAKVTSPTLAMFGEYAGAKTNPEYALREDQLMGLIGGRKELYAETILRGSDILIAFTEAQRKQGSTFG